MWRALNIGSLRAYITPPIVYIIPPAKSHANAAAGSALIIWVKDRTHAQPMMMYNADDTHLGHVTQQSLKIMPIMAMPHTRANRL